MSRLASIFLATFCLASAIPRDAAVWFIRGDACGEVLLRWSSNEATFVNATVASVPPSGAPDFASLQPHRLFSASSVVYKSISVTSYTSPHISTLALDDVAPGERYAVQLWGDDGVAVYTFIAPLCEATPGESIGGATDPVHTLLFAGDIGTTENSAAVMAAAQGDLVTRGYAPSLNSSDDASMQRGAASLLIVGDLSYADGDPTEWDAFQVSCREDCTFTLFFIVRLCLFVLSCRLWRRLSSLEECLWFPFQATTNSATEPTR